MDQALQQAKGKIDPDKINPKLAALSLARELMRGDNPTTAIINDEFCLGNALMKAINEQFFMPHEDTAIGLMGIVSVFDEFEMHSPSIGGVGRQQVVECVVNASRPVYQGFNPLYEEDKPGIFERLANFIRGNKQPGT